MSLRYKVFEASSPINLQNQVNIDLLMEEKNEGRDVEIVNQSYFVKTDDNGERHYLSVFYNSSLK